jgi:hypothetical protein
MGKKVTVELTGPARIQAGRKEVSITVEDGATWRDVMAALAQALPMLVGKAITEDRRNLIGPYLLNLGGRRTIRDFDEEAQVKEGDFLSLLEETC